MLGRLLLSIALLVILSGGPASAEITRSLDVAGWLDRHGTRMLAVEFYSPSCKECVAAEPRWKTLHAEYANKGLRVIVIAARQPDGTCATPGWRPNLVVCDADGRIAQTLGVDQNLPAAFLWSWRGDLVVSTGHIAEVTQAVEKRLTARPRVIVAPTTDKEKQVPITALPFVQTSFMQTNAVRILVGPSADGALAKVPDRPTPTDTACTPDTALAGDSVLHLAIDKDGAQEQLSMRLHDLATGCLVAATDAQWSGRAPVTVISYAAEALLNSLRKPFTRPTVAPAKPPPERPGASWREAEAYVRIAIKYESGEAGTKDDAQAASLYKETCDMGYVRGCAYYAFMLADGRGVPKDRAGAAALYAQACAGRNMRACSNLADMIQNSRGIVKDMPRAVALFTKACDGGYLLGCRNLGQLYETGQGGTKDAPRAAALYEKGCNGGHMRSCYDLAFMVADGIGVPKDLARKVALFKKSCDGGYMSSCFSLGISYHNGSGVRKDRRKAKQFFGQACDGGVKDACKHR